MKQTQYIKILPYFLALALVACGDDGGDGVVDAQPASDAPIAVSDVTGTMIERHVTSAGTQTTPIDLSDNFNLRLWTVDGDGVFTEHAGAGMADGSFAFPDVPEGMTYLQHGIRYFYTDQRAYDLGNIWSFRSDVTTPTQATILDLDFDGLTPWADGHALYLYADGVDMAVPFGGESVPANDGDTALATALDYNQATGGFGHLIDSTLGDALWFAQLAPQTIPGMAFTYSSVVKALEVPTVQMRDGETSSIAGTFQDVVQNRTLDIDWRGSAFNNLTEQMLPASAQVGSQQLSVAAAAIFNTFEAGAQAAGADLFIANPSPADQDLSFTADVANPFPADWAELALFIWTITSTVDDGAGGTLDLRVSYVAVGRMNELFGSPLQPEMSPVRDLLIEGMDADIMRTGLPESPELSWSPPTQGTPDFYEVMVRQLLPTGPQLRARLRTAGTSIRVPPGLMEVGERYAFEVRGWAVDNSALAGPFGQETGITIGRTTHIMSR